MVPQHVGDENSYRVVSAALLRLSTLKGWEVGLASFGFRSSEKYLPL